jgi:hypothetical protein
LFFGYFLFVSMIASEPSVPTLRNASGAIEFTVQRSIKLTA